MEPYVILALGSESFACVLVHQSGSDTAEYQRPGPTQGILKPVRLFRSQEHIAINALHDAIRVSR